MNKFISNELTMLFNTYTDIAKQKTSIRKLESKLEKKRASLDSLQDKADKLSREVCAELNEKIGEEVFCVGESVGVVKSVPTTVEELRVGDIIKIVDIDSARGDDDLPGFNYRSRLVVVSLEPDCEEGWSISVQPLEDTDDHWWMQDAGWEFVSRPSE